MNPAILLIGLGDLGGVVLELLAREESLGRIVVASRSPERGVARCNLARLSASAQGLVPPEIRFVPLDLRNIERTAELIDREQPALILHTATTLTWWLPQLLPKPAAERLARARFGVWLPVHLALSLKLMQAVEAADYRGHTLIAPYPDVVNCVLGRVGPAPTCGVGNVDEIVAKITLLAAETLDAPFSELEVSLVAHHALWRAAFADAQTSEPLPPYFLRVKHHGRDVTAEIAADQLVVTTYPVPGGRATHSLTAGCTVRLIRALLTDAETRLHVPGPGGLPGGYPILASRAGVRLAPLEGLTQDQAIAINESSHRADGIERIEPDGSVAFLPQAVAILRDALGYDCERLPPSDAEARAGELTARFRDYAAEHGVDLTGRLRHEEP